MVSNFSSFTEVASRFGLEKQPLSDFGFVNELLDAQVHQQKPHAQT